MNRRIGQGALMVTMGCMALTGCSHRTVDFTQIKAPQRADEMAAFNVFVGNWDWDARIDGADEASGHWTGTASWEWALNGRCLRGDAQFKCQNAAFDAMGVWTWHPGEEDYIWSIYTNWGYPQVGEAKYDADAKMWVMRYKGIGLDGTKGYGVYHIDVSNPDKLGLHWIEWADRLHLIKKIELTGTYTRRM